MTPDQLKRLRELAGKATPGPWLDVEGLHVADQSGGPDICRCVFERNAAYIAAADPTTILWLLDRLEKWRTQLTTREAELEAELRDIRDRWPTAAEHDLGELIEEAVESVAPSLRPTIAGIVATEVARYRAKLESAHATAARALESERDGMAEALRLARERVRELEAEHEHCSTAIAYSEDHTREVAAERIADLEARLLGCVTAMELWGSWEDGVPEGGPGEHGIVGNAYDMAKATLGLGDANGQRIGAAMARMRSDRALGGKLAELEQVVARVRELASLQFGPEVFPAAYATRLRSIAAILPKEDT